MTPRSLTHTLPSRSASLVRRLACVASIALGLAALAALAPSRAGAATAAATRVVRYDGWSARVPASWPVDRLGAGSHVCVRFDRHAVYLGRPGAQEDCPTHALGRTEAVLVTPRAGAGSRASASALAPDGGAVAEVVPRGGRVLVTATWGRDPGQVRSALHVGSVAAAGRAWARRAAAIASRAAARGAAGGSRVGSLGHGRATPTRGAGADSLPAPVASAVATPGAVYTGLGFDACSAPSQTTMTDWASSPFRAVGVYLGGANMACNQANLTPTWVAAQAATGWHLIPIYVGLQAPGNGCGCAAISTANAAAQGTAAAASAVQEAQALGLGAGNPIYDDMENYPRTATSSDAVLTYLAAWTTGLHEAGYTSGVYSSELSGISDLVAQQGSGYEEPDDIWVANWNGQESTADPDVPSADWADHQRLHQFRGGHSDAYGGVTLSVDSDYIDAATAAPGATNTVSTTIAAAPTVAVRPQADGSLLVSPSWPGESAVSRWQVVAGSSPSALAGIGTVPSAHATFTTSSAYPYFQVAAYDAAGQELGLSGTVATPSHVAIFGRTAFVAAHGPGGLPVSCFSITACRASTTISTGHQRLVRTRPQRVPAGGGLVLFSLSTAEHRLITRAGNAGLPVTVTVRATGGQVATRTMKLVRFQTSGRGPRRVAGSSAALRVLGVTDFVSHGWTGAILVSCRRTAPCSATPTLRIGRTRLATAAAQTIGAGEVGYLTFHMTSAGHARLMHATGNQLGVSLTVSSSGAGLSAPVTAHAQIAIDAF